MSTPDWSRVFVRGLGWVHVSVRPARPSAASSVRYAAGLTTGALTVLRKLSECAAGCNLSARLAGLRRRLRACRYLLDRWDSTRGYPGEGPSARKFLEVSCLFQNVRGLADDAKRRAYLRHTRSQYPIVALAETNCTPACEGAFARDWGTGQTFWSSSPDGTHCRGVGLLVADSVLLTDARAHHDAEGRLLVVEATCFREHKVLFIVSYAPADSDAENRAFFAALPAFVTSRVPDAARRHVVWFGDHNNVPNPSLDQLPPPGAGGPADPKPLGGAAFCAAAASLQLSDLFRHHRKHACEYTRVPRGNVTALTHASRRLDRVLVSASLLAARGAPRAVGCWHVNALDPLVAPRFLESGQYTSKPSDHAAVACRLAFSAQPKPRGRWTFHARHLLDATTLEAMRAIIVRVVAEDGTAHARVERLRGEITEHVKSLDATQAAARAGQKRGLQRTLDGIDYTLGQSVQGRQHAHQLSPHATHTLQAKRARVAAELDAILEQEDGEWLAQRGFESHMESRPRKALFQSLEIADPERQMPIEAIAEDNSLVRDTPSLVSTVPRAASPSASKIHMRGAHSACRTPASDCSSTCARFQLTQLVASSRPACSHPSVCARPSTKCRCTKCQVRTASPRSGTARTPRS